MTYGGFTYGGRAYGSGVVPEAGSSVTLRPAVVEVVAAPTTVKVGVKVALAPAVVDLAAPPVTPGVFDDAYHAAALALSPTIYWRLGESSGTTAADESGNGYTGQYTNTPTLGVTGLLAVDSDTAITLDAASTEFVYIHSTTSPAGPTQASADDKTVITWVSTTDSDACLLYSSLRLYIDATGKVRAETNDAEGPVTSAAAINDGNPHMVAATYTASTKTIELWVDGVSEGTNTATNHPSLSTWFKLGTNTSNLDPLSGTVDEAKLWISTKVADADIEHLYEVGSGGGPVTIGLAPAVLDVAAPRVTPVAPSITVDLLPAVVDIAAPPIGSPSAAITVTLAAAVVDIVAARMPRRMNITAWTLDDYGSTAFGMEVQQEVDVRWGDPVAEAGWQPIRTNRVTWSSIEVNTATGRPRTPTNVTVTLEPAVLEVAAPGLQF